MTDNELNIFIDTMHDHGDEWSFDEAKHSYGDDTLEDAIKDRTAVVNMLLNNIAALTK